MIIAHIRVSGVTAVCKRRSQIPARLVGGKVVIEYADPVWAELNKTAVFRGAVTRDVLNIGELVEIPPEVLEKVGSDVYFGIEGRNADGTLVIPLIEAQLGKVLASTDPSGDESTDPSLPVWAQLEQRVEQLENTGGSGGGGIYFETDETLTLKNGVLSVNTADAAEQDNTLPITSAAVHTTVGNIELLLSRI